MHIVSKLRHQAAGDECYRPGIMVGILVAGQGDYDSAGCPVTYPQGEGGETVSGALTLLDHASSTASSNTVVSCAGASPTAVGQTFAPTAAPTTAAPTARSAAYRGEIKCGDAKTGDTDIPGTATETATLFAINLHRPSLFSTSLLNFTLLNAVLRPHAVWHDLLILRV